MDNGDEQPLERDLDQSVSRAKEEVRSPNRELVDRDAAELATRFRSPTKPAEDEHEKGVMSSGRADELGGQAR